MIDDIVDSLSAYGDAFSLINKYKLWKYLILSGIISLIVGTSLIAFSISLSDNIGHWLTDLYPWDFGQGFIASIANFLAGGVLVVGTLLVYKYVVMIVVSPIMSILSEDLETKLNGYKREIKWSLPTMISNILRGIGLTLSNITKEIFYTILLFVFGFIPIIGLLSIPAIFLLQAYFAGFGNMDFYLERHMNIRESTDFVRANRGVAIGNGMIYILILIIPVVGFVLAPTLGAVTATYEVHNRLEDHSEMV